MDKKYFLRDTEIHTTDEDFFRHQDIADNITRILRTNKPPYNIAVIGKWGLGKSSLINFVMKNLEADQEIAKKEQFIKIDINAWKYEKEVLAKVFLRQVMEALDTYEQKPKKTHLEISLNTFKKVFLERPEETDKKSIWWEVKALLKQNKKFLLLGALVTVATVLLYGFYKYVNLSLLGTTWDNFWEFLAMWFTGYCRNVVVLLFVPIFLSISTLLVNDSHKRTMERYEVRLPSYSVEDYEIKLEEKIRETVGNNPDFKIIIILDDMDRLSAKKMMEALDAMKMFINFKNCIFIVPFDDSILKKAIERVRIGGNENEYLDNLDGEQYLDKLFQYKIYLSPLLKTDIRAYAVSLCMEQMSDFVKEYCPEQIFRKVIYNILVHSQVQTPRQVKKNVNIFATNLMIARAREEAGEVEPGFATKEQGICMIAKLSVLQADFNEFYDLLFEEDGVMEKVLNAHEDENAFVRLSPEIKAFFRVGRGETGFKKQFLPLLNFLSRTVQYQVDNLSSYLYVAMDEISIKTGSRKQQEFLQAATSGNVATAVKLLKDTPELIDAAINFMQNEDDAEEIKNVMLCTLGAWDDMEEEKQNKAADAVAQRASEIEKIWRIDSEDKLGFAALVEGYCMTGNKTEYEKLLNSILSDTYKGRALEKLTAFCDAAAELTEDLQELLQDHIEWVLNNDMVKPMDMIEVKQKYPLSTRMWDSYYYSFLLRGIRDNKDYGNQITTEVQAVFKKMATDENVTELLGTAKELFGVPQLADMFCEMLSSRVKQIDQGLRNDLIFQQLGNASGNAEAVNQLLQLTDYEVEEGQEEAYDNYFLEQIKEQDFAKMVTVFCEMNAAALLKNSLNAYFDWLLEEEVTVAQEDVTAICEVLDDVQVADLKEKIMAETAFETAKEYHDISMLIAALAKRDEENAVLVLDKWIEELGRNTANNCYVDMVDNAVVRMSAFMDEARTDAYVGALESVINSGGCRESAIAALCHAVTQMSEGTFVRVCALLEDKLDAAYCLKIYHALNRRKNLINKNNSNLGLYREVCQLVFEHTTKKDEAIQSLHDTFNTISQLPRLIKDVLEAEGIDVPAAYATIRKLLDHSDENRAVQDVLQVLNGETDLERLTEILKGTTKNTIGAMADYMTQNADSLDVPGMCRYFELMLLAPEAVTGLQLSDYMMALVNRGEKEADYEQIVELVEKMEAQHYQGLTRKYISPFVTLLQKTNNIKRRERIVQKAKQLKLLTAVKKQVSQGVLKSIKEIEKRGKE